MVDEIYLWTFQTNNWSEVWVDVVTPFFPKEILFWVWCCGYDPVLSPVGEVSR